jgi:hypothetical protein
MFIGKGEVGVVSGPNVKEKGEVGVDQEGKCEGVLLHTCVQFKYVPTDGEYIGLFICLILQAVSLSSFFTWGKAGE